MVMDVEQYLLTAISAVTGALVFVVKILWSDMRECRRDRSALWQRLEDMKTHNGELRGFLEAVGLCRQTDCQFARPARHTSSKPFKETTIGLSVLQKRQPIIPKQPNEDDQGNT
jgi:hypothetical protein